MEKYKVGEIKKSIVANGYVPTDAIFVTVHEPSGKFLVREGNRRVTAIKQLIDAPDDLPKETKQDIENLSVLEVLTDGDKELADRLHELPDSLIWVHCGSGYRASIAASIIDRAGGAVVLVDDEYSTAETLHLTSTRQPADSAVDHGPNLGQ